MRSVRREAPLVVAGVVASIVGLALSACSSTTTSPTPTEDASSSPLDAGRPLFDAGTTDAAIARDGGS